MVHRVFIVFLSVFALGFPVSSARAQTEARQETLGNMTDQIQGEVEAQQVAFRAASPELGEIGLVQRQPAPDTFTLFTSQNLFYTDNAFLLDSFKVGSWAYSGRFGVTVVPWSVRDWTPSITIDQTIFRYDRVSALDFDAQTINFSLRYDLTRDDTWSLRGSYALTRIFTSRFDAGDIYKFGELDLSLTHFRQLGERGVSPFFFNGSFGLGLRNGDPSAFDRFEVEIPLMLIYTPMQQVQVYGFVRPSFQFYTNDPFKGNRRDINLVCGLGVNYQVTSWFSVGANYSYTGNYSNVDFREYNVNMPGFTVSGRLTF